MNQIFNVFIHLKNISGIITPYRKQVSAIKAHINDKNLYECSVGTINKFQGLERKVIIISMVRNSFMGFTKNPKLFNVAVSRAKALLIVVGNPTLLSERKCWQLFIDYCYRYTGCHYKPSILL